MYQLEKTINLVTIATPLNNNLALLDVDEHISADTLAVINGGYINVIPILNPIKRAKYVSITSGEQRGKERVTEVSCFEFYKFPYFNDFLYFRSNGYESTMKLYLWYYRRSVYKFMIVMWPT